MRRKNVNSVLEEKKYIGGDESFCKARTYTVMRHIMLKSEM